MDFTNGQFHWWEGVVEDNLDPTGAGRCKVRVIGHNTPDKSELSRVELPWAYPVLPLNNPHGKIVGLKPGTRVMGFYRDGDMGQDLVMLGTINTGYSGPTGFNEDFPANILTNLADPVDRGGRFGFTDDRLGVGEPIENQPKKTQLIVDDKGRISFEEISDYGNLLVNEINTPRLARGIPQDTYTQAHAQSQSLTSVTKTDGSKINEPQNPYAAKYPFNTVEESDSGHTREVDDTPGAERIKETHRTGTFYEIHPDGSRVTKVVKDDFSVIIGDKGVKIDGICAIHVVGQADFYCESDVQIKTDMNAVVEANRDAKVSAGNDLFGVAGNDVRVKASRDALVTAETNLDVIAGGDMSIQAGGEILFKDISATASNVDEIIKDTIDGKGKARIRVDDPS